MDTQPMTVRFPPDVYEELRREAFDTHGHMNTIVVEAVKEHQAARGLRGQEVNHKDGGPLNNDPANLELRKRDPE